MLEVDVLEVVADKGYDSRDDIMDSIMSGIIPNVALKYENKEHEFILD